MRRRDTNTNDGHRARLRSRVLDRAGVFAAHEFVELLLFYTVPRADTNPIAHRMLARYGSLQALLDAPPGEVARDCRVGEKTAAVLSVFGEILARGAAGGLEPPMMLNDSVRAGEYAAYLLSDEAPGFWLFGFDDDMCLLDVSPLGGEPDIRALLPLCMNSGCTRVILVQRLFGAQPLPDAPEPGFTAQARAAFAESAVMFTDFITVSGAGTRQEPFAYRSHRQNGKPQAYIHYK